MRDEEEAWGIDSVGPGMMKRCAKIKGFPPNLCEGDGERKIPLRNPPLRHGKV